MQVSSSAPCLEATAGPTFSRSATANSFEVSADLRYLTHDPKLVDKLMRKRQEEMARRSKLLNTRSFRHGVPHDLLDKQVAEKQAAAAAEKVQDQYHDHYRVVSDQVAQVCESIRHEATRERQKAVTAFSLEHCRKEQRREYHLSDPNMLKTERPARDGDNDPRLGPSSVQNFEGEDFLAQARKKEAVTSTRQWLIDQMAQKKEYQNREKASDRLYDESQVTANEVRGICERADREDAIMQKRIEAAENKDIAREHHARKQAAKLREAAAVEAHVNHELTSGLTMEQADYKLGVDGRLMKGEYKRLSVGEEQAVYDSNARLLLERKARVRAEKSGDTAELQQQFTADSVLNTVMDVKARRERQRRTEIEDFNKSLVLQKKDYDVLERKAYRSNDHIEPYTSTANQFS